MIKLKKSRLILCVLFFIIQINIPIQIPDSSKGESAIDVSLFSNKYVHTQKSVCGGISGGAYKEFLNMSSRGFVIPGLSENFVPQGLAFCEYLDSFMISGYSDIGGAAYIITVSAKSGRINGEYKILSPDGIEFTGHSGGIAAYGRYVYITDGYVLCYVSMFDFDGASSEVKISGRVNLPASSSFVSVYDGYLWAGNFYHRTPVSRSDISASDSYGDVYRTAIFGYRLDWLHSGGIRQSEGKIDNTAKPFAVIFAPDEVQGTAFTADGRIYLSCSYGRRNMSVLSIYKYPLAYNANKYVNIDGRTIPAWFLNNDYLIKTVSAPPMSEGAVFRDGKVYVIFESAASKYRDTALDPTDCVWAITNSPSVS